MALFIPSPQVCKVEMCYTWNDQKVENVWHMKHGAGDPDEATMELLAENLKGWFNASMKGNTHTSCSLRLIRITLLTTSTSPGIEYSSGLPIAGTFNTSASSPNNVTLAVKWITGLRGRSYRGRTYIPGLAQAFTVGNQISAGMLTAYNTAYQALLSGLLAGWTFGVNSQYASKLPRGTAVFTPITGFTIETNVDSMRRRLTGRGQ